MKALLLPLLFPYVKGINEPCTFHYGQWKPEPGQCFALVLRELGVNRQQVQGLNPGVDIDDIFPSIPYNVPYNVPRYSAVWSIDCPPMLQLSDGAGYTNSLVCGNRQGAASQPPSPTAKAKATPSSRYSSDGGSTTTDATSTSVPRRPALPLSSLSAVQSRHEGDKKNIPSDTSSSQEATTSSTPPRTRGISTSLAIASSRNTIKTSRTSSVASSGEETDSTSRTLPAVGTATASGALLSTDSSEPYATLPTTGTATSSATLPAEHCSRKLTSSSTDTAQEMPASPNTTPTKKKSTSLATSMAEESATPSSDMQPSAATNTETTRAVEDPTRKATSSVTGLSTSSTNDNERKSLMELMKTLLSEEPSRSSAEASSRKAMAATETSDAQSTVMSTGKINTKSATTIVSSAIKTKTSSATTPNEKDEETTTRTTSSDETSVAKATSSSTASSSHYSKNQKTTLHRTKSAPREKATATTADLSQTSLPAPTCGDEADLPGHGDIAKWTVQVTAAQWCDDGWYQRSVGPKDKCSLGVKWSGGIGYEYSICWAEGCVGEAQDRKTPLGSDGPSCKDIMFKNWNDCNNGGVGGVTQAGCLLFKFRGGVGKSQGYKKGKEYKQGERP